MEEKVTSGCFIHNQLQILAGIKLRLASIPVICPLNFMEPFLFSLVGEAKFLWDFHFLSHLVRGLSAPLWLIRKGPVTIISPCCQYMLCTMPVIEFLSLSNYLWWWDILHRQVDRWRLNELSQRRTSITFPIQATIPWSKHTSRP